MRISNGFRAYNDFQTFSKFIGYKIYCPLHVDYWGGGGGEGGNLIFVYVSVKKPKYTQKLTKIHMEFLFYWELKSNHKN